MLIIEGTDLVGKTTLCKKLVAALANRGYVYRHLSRLPESFDHFRDYVPLMARKTVCDRFHMSEVAYATARGERPRVSQEVYRLLDAKVRLLGGFTVVITALPKLLEERRQRVERNEMYGIDAICHANTVFNQCVMQTFEKYQTDCDFHIHCNEENPWPNEGQAAQIIERYVARQNLWQNLSRE